MKFLILSLITFFSVLSLSQGAESTVPAPVKIEQAEKKIVHGVQLIDVRTKKEWEEGHLEGATRITVNEKEFLTKAKAILDPKKEVLVYCRSGKRSALAAEQLRAAGFIVYDMDGGILAWEAAGKPVKK